MYKQNNDVITRRQYTVMVSFWLQKLSDEWKQTKENSTLPITMQYVVADSFFVCFVYSGENYVLDLQGRSQKATLVVFVVISSLL